MKAKYMYGLLLMLSFSLISLSCSSDDEKMDSNNSADIILIKNIIQSNSWQITSFVDSGIDETNHFTGYSFTFYSNGILMATNDSNEVNGTWSIIDSSNSNDDSNSSDDIDFNIFFPSPANFSDDLSEDWEILSKNDNEIQLIHISGGNGGTDTLTFEKN